MSAPKLRVTRGEMATRNRRALAKAFVLGDSIDQPASRQDTESSRESLFDKSAAIEPPHDPETLAALLEVSNSLRQNVDAYKVNIDGFGHRFEPIIDLDADNAADVVSDIIVMERMRAKGVTDIAEVEQPSEEELSKRVLELRRRIRIEGMQLRNFFAFAADRMSFPALRKLTRQDMEVMGYGFWEVMRNNAGEIARFVYVPSWTIRLRKLIEDPVTVKERFPITPITFSEVDVKRQFRTYVQILEAANPVFFKEFGDSRTVSRDTGEVFADAADLKKAEPEAIPATEMIYFEIPSPRSAYGVPRWIGNLISVLGSRAAEEVNFFYFENKAIPPMAILVSGGRLSKSSVPKIEDFIENRIKGRKNFHKILIIEAVSPQGKGADVPNAQRPTIELKTLTEAQLKDALFQEYDERNMDKVGMSFRLPRLLRGDSKDFNRATAGAAMQMAEKQVFQPERDDFDFRMNREILPVLGAVYHRFVSNSPVSRDPETMGKIVNEAVENGILTPAEGRVLLGDVFNRDFAVINEAWARQPIQFTLAGIQTGQAAPVSSAKGGLSSGSLAAAGGLRPAQGDPPKIPSITSDDSKGFARLSQMIIGLRDAMTKQETADERRQLIKDRSEAGDTITIEVTAEEMDRLIERRNGG